MHLCIRQAAKQIHVIRWTLTRVSVCVCVCVCVSIYLPIYLFIYLSELERDFKELAHVSMEAEKFQDLVDISEIAEIKPIDH